MNPSENQLVVVRQRAEKHGFILLVLFRISDDYYLLLRLLIYMYC